MRALSGGFVTIAALVLASVAAVAQDAPGGPIRINEVAWAGAEWDAAAEWIELYNASAEPVDLAGWHLVSSDGSPSIELDGTIGPRIAGDPASGFYLLERTDDDSVPGVAADRIYRGALTDRGEALYLYDAEGRLSDAANAPDGTDAPWPAGTDAKRAPSYASMERVDYRLPDSPENWASSKVELRLGPSERPLRGTPRSENSVFNVPPTPSFGVEPRSPTPGAPVTFDASGSSDENDPIASYRWDFGDGQDGSGSIASHTYALPGDYVVTLSLTDVKGGASEASCSVRVRERSLPVADFSVIPLGDDVPRTGSPVRFRDESSDVDGQIVSWEWDLGDGATAGDEVVEHAYDRPGEYLVLLRVVDDQFEAAIQSQSVHISNRFPIGAFTHSPDRPSPNDPIRFDASGSHDPDGEIAAYRWDFDGDGIFDQEVPEPVVEHTFETAGEWVVTLTVVDDFGDVSPPLAATIPINNPPIAAFQLSESQAPELAPIRFTDLSHDEDGAIVCWLWQFGDGGTAAEAGSEHAFQSAGTYTVSLTVTDDGGARHTTVAQVTITNLPPAAQLSADRAERPTGASFRFDASGSSDPSPGGSITQYEWDFDGDGMYERTSSSPTLSRAYSDDGTFAVGLRVIDDDGAFAVADPLCVRVVNRAPRIDRIQWTPAAPTDAEDVLLIASAHDPDGNIVQWFWDFGDGVVVTASGPTVRFPEDGRHTVAVTVQDDDGARSDPFSVEIVIENASPVAAFAVATVDVRCVAFDATISHDLSPSGEIRHVAWDFGDGASCPGDPAACGDGGRFTPVHCYSAPGTYIVTLVVIDNRGAMARTAKTVLIAK